MKSLARVTVILACGLLAACASSNYTDTEDWDLTARQKFIKHLHIGYVELSRYEGEEWDWADSKIFGEKARPTGNGQIVDPELVEDWNVPADTVSELTTARGRLMSALASGGPEVMPSIMAQAQVMFDCWIEEQEDNDDPERIAECRDGFYKAIGQVEAALNRPVPEEPAPVVEAAPMEAAVAPELQRSYLVFFDWDRAIVTAEAAEVIARAAAAAEEFGVVTLIVTGHADLSGPNDYNMSLSLRRANAVKDALIALGMSADSVTVLGRGEEDPLVPTPDGVREAQNRRAEILLER